MASTPQWVQRLLRLAAAAIAAAAAAWLVYQLVPRKGGGEEKKPRRLAAGVGGGGGSRWNGPFLDLIKGLECKGEFNQTAKHKQIQVHRIRTCIQNISF